MLRARDEMDRCYADPLDIPKLASTVHFHPLSSDDCSSRCTARPLTAICTPAGRTRHDTAPADRSAGHRRRPGRGSPASAPSARPSPGSSATHPPTPRPPRVARGAVLLRRVMDRPRHAHDPSSNAVVLKKPGRPRLGSVDTMTNHITSLHIRSVPVLDQDEALSFYAGTSVSRPATTSTSASCAGSPSGSPGRTAPSCSSGSVPQHDPATAAQVRDLVTKGALGAAAILHTDDVPQDVRDPRCQRRRDHPGAGRAALRHRYRDP